MDDLGAYIAFNVLGLIVIGALFGVALLMGA